MGSIAISGPPRVHVVRSSIDDGKRIEVPVGLTVAEALEISMHESGAGWPTDQIVASIGTWRIPRDKWHVVRPREGRVVVFRQVAADGKILRSVLGIAAAIAALFVAPIIGAAIGGFFGTAAGIGLIGGAITIGATLLINALIPMRPAQIETGGSGKQLIMIGGAQNEARPWETIPVVLGRHRMSPLYAARPYTFFAGNKQYVNMLFCVGYGRLALSQLKLGETPLVSFEEVEYEAMEGSTGSTFTTLFPQIVNETPLSITLRSADGFNVRSTGPDTDQISIDLIAPQGIFSYNKETGAYDDRPVIVQVRYRLVGTVPWTNRPNVVFTRTKESVRRGDRWAVARGNYEVGVAKFTTDYVGGGQVAEEILWITLRAFTHAHPVNFSENLSTVAIRIKGTDQLNGIVNNFNLVAESYVRGYDGSSWNDDVLSRNNADLFRHVLQGPANARPRTDAQIDLDSIEDWWQDCVDNDFSYNAVHADRRSVREVLADIAAAGRATVALRNGKWGVSFPRATDTISWHFNPRNSASFRTERIYREMPHALRVRFIDQDHGWRERERIVYDDGYDASNATLFEQAEFPGVTRSQNIWRHGRFQIAQARLRPEKHNLGADAESLRLERGDKVEVSSDVILVGTGYGRVKAVDSIGQTVTIDSRVIMEVGNAYGIRFRLADGTTLERVVFNTANETNVIVLDPMESTTMPEVGDLFSFGETERITRSYRVLEVRPGSDLSAEFALVDDAPEIDEADQGTIPDYDPGITDPPDPYALVPQSLSVSERLSGSGITTKSIVEVTVQIPRTGRIRAFEFQYKDVDAGGEWEPFAVVAAPHLTATRENLEPGSWQFRVRTLFAEGDSTRDDDVSAWIESDVASLLGILSPPDDVTGLEITTLGDSTRLTWDAVGTRNFKNYLVKYSRQTGVGVTWGGSLELVSPVTNEANVPTRPGTYSVKAVTFSEIESVNAAFVTSFVEGPERNVVEIITESPTFPGTDSGTQNITGDLLTLDLDSSGLYVVTGTYYFSDSIDLGAVYTSRIEAIVEAAGISIGDTMDTWTSLASLEALDTTDPSLWAVTLLYRWTNDDPLVSGASWSDWTPFSIADVTARALEFAVLLTGSADGRVSPGISVLGVSVDMPDRHLGFKDQQSGTSALGFTIDFDPEFKALRDVTTVFHDLNTTAGEKFEVLSKDESHVTVRFKNSVGTVIDRKFDLHAFGYGVVIPTVT